MTLQSRDGRALRAPLVIAADGVHSVIAKRLGVNARWPRDEPGDRHDGRDAGRDAARRRGPTCCGSPTRTTASTATRTSSRRRGTSTSASGACSRTSTARCRTRPYDAAAAVRLVARRASGVLRRPVRSAALHAVSDSRRRTAAAARARPRAVRRRRRRLRPRDHGRRHLLRDGLRRAGRPRADRRRRRRPAAGPEARRPDAYERRGGASSAPSSPTPSSLQRICSASHDRVSRVVAAPRSMADGLIGHDARLHREASCATRRSAGGCCAVSDDDASAWRGRSVMARSA